MIEKLKAWIKKEWTVFKKWLSINWVHILNWLVLVLVYIINKNDVIDVLVGLLIFVQIAWAGYQWFKKQNR